MYNCDPAGCRVLHSQNAASRPVLERSHHASQCRGPCSCSHLATRIKQQWSEPLHGIGSQRHGLTAAFARGPAACYSILRQPGACSTNVDVLDCALGACAAHNCLPDDAHTVIEDAHSEQLCEACVGLTQCRLVEVLACVLSCFHPPIILTPHVECREGLQTFRSDIMICPNVGMRSIQDDDSSSALHALLQAASRRTRLRCDGMLARCSWYMDCVEGVRADTRACRCWAATLADTYSTCSLPHSTACSASA